MCQMYICACVCGCVFLWKCAPVEYCEFAHVCEVWLCVGAHVFGVWLQGCGCLCGVLWECVHVGGCGCGGLCVGRGCKGCVSV